MSDAPPDPSSFPALIGGLGAQGQIFLGALENPLTQKLEPVNLPRARVVVNTLAMLAEKTRGNLHPEEDKFLQAVLTDLRMRYVQQSGGEQADAGAAGADG